MPDLLCNIMHNLIDKCLDLTFLCQDPTFQIYVNFPIVMVMPRSRSEYLYPKYLEIPIVMACKIIQVNRAIKILEISLARSFKNLAIEPCKILAKIRQDLGSKYTRYLIVIIMQDHNGKNFKILKAFLLGLQDISENAPSIRHGRHSILYYSNGKGLYNVC